MSIRGFRFRGRRIVGVVHRHTTPASGQIRPVPTAGERLGAGAPNRSLPPRLARTGEVLDLVRRGVAVTTTDLASAMSVVRSTVSERLDILLRHGLLVPAGDTSPGRGRPATVHAFNQRAGVTLTAQVGMSGVHVAVTDLGGDVLWSNHVQFDAARGPDAMFALLEGEFASGLESLDSAKVRVHGIGIGLPGELAIDPPRPGADDGASTWAGDPIASQLTEAFDCPVFIDRDVNFLALGEHRSAWPDAKMFLCLKVGTVIACGLVIDGRVVRGATGLFGEIGHAKVPGNDAICHCGSAGCLNAVAGGAALAETLAQRGFDAHSARDLAVLARQGVTEAGRAVRQAGHQIGDVIATAINLLNPDVVTVWGYLADASDQFLAGMHEAIYRDGLPPAARAATLERSRLGDHAGIYGAALTVIDHTLRPDAVDRFVAQHAEC